MNETENDSIKATIAPLNEYQSIIGSHKLNIDGFLHTHSEKDMLVDNSLNSAPEQKITWNEKINIC